MEDEDHLRVEEFLNDVPLAAGVCSGQATFFSQHDETDCAAACMAMVSKYYQKHVSVGAWRSMIYVTREGASILSTQRAASSAGFDAIGVSASLRSLSNYRLP